MGNSSGNIFTYYNWKTPIVDLDDECIRTGVYAFDSEWGNRTEKLYEQLTYEGAGQDYEQYISGFDRTIVLNILQWNSMPEFSFEISHNGQDSYGNPNGTNTVIAIKNG